MYRTAASRAKALKSQSGYRGWARSESTSAVASKSAPGGLFSWLVGEKSSSLPPLDFPLKGVTVPPPLPDFIEPGKTRITTLQNGLRIASEASSNPAASISLHVKCGSMYERPSQFGVTHLLEKMAFKSTLNRSQLRLIREVEAIGGNISASGSREHMGYTFDALKTYVPKMVELLVDSVRSPAFLDWEVNEQIEKVKAEIEELSKNPENLILEAIHATGYSGPYGNGLLATEPGLTNLNSSVLEEFVAENYTAPRMVLAAHGVDHDKLLEYAEPLLSDLPKVIRPEEPKPIYTGGDFRRQDKIGTTHFALAFELPGGWVNDKDAMTLTVLQMLMGGGGSFSAGGPGKGMHSRLYLRVLNQYHDIESFTAFCSIFDHSGLFGISATSGVEHADKVIDIAVQEFLSIATPGEVEKVQLDRAKQATKSAILMNLESRMVASEDIGRQLLSYGERKPVEHFLKAVDEVTLEDITKVAQKLISSPLTMASCGDVLRLPSYDSVSRKFH